MTMNEADVDTRHSYNRYMLETLQIEYERAQEMRDIVQAQNMCDEHTSPHATQVAAAGMMHDVGDAVNDDEMGLEEWDEWLDEVYSREEVERAQREQEERRDDH